MDVEELNGNDWRNTPCALCNAEPVYLYHPAQSPGPVVRCSNCGLVYVGSLQDTQAIITSGPVTSNLAPDILHSGNLQDLDGCWELATLAEKESELPALRRNARRALDRLTCLTDKLGRLLDFGCGGGFFLAEAAKQGWKTVGLEPLAGHAVYARAKFHLNIVTDVLHDDTFPPNFFDVITAFQVFEHLLSPVHDLSLLASCLKPGGLILIEVPNIDTWGVKLLKSKHRHFVRDHLYFFSAKTLDKLVKICGLEPLETYYPVHWMTPRHLIRYFCTIVGIHLSQMPKLFGSLIIPMSLHDIVAILAQKPASAI